MVRKIKYIIDQNYDSVRTFLKRQGYSRRAIIEMKKLDSGIVLNSERVFVNVPLNVNDELVLTLLEDTSSIVPVRFDVTTVYEDEDIIVFDKPPYMPVHPTKKHQSDTLANHFSSLFENTVFRAVNRLDKNTSGIVIVAKNKFVASRIRDCEKIYMCICHGELPACGEFNGSISLENGSKMKRCVSTDGKPANTKYVRVFTDGNYSVALVKILTGRTHQIRVHFSSEGYPIAGDTLYGDANDDLNRQALHCISCRFSHPVNSNELQINTQMPEDLLTFARRKGIELPTPEQVSKVWQNML